MTMNHISLSRPHEQKKGVKISSNLNLHETIFPESNKTFFDTVNKVIQSMQVPYLLASLTQNEQTIERFYDGLHAYSHFTELEENQRKITNGASKLHFYVITELGTQKQNNSHSKTGHYIGSNEIFRNAGSRSLLDVLIHTYRAQPSNKDFFEVAEKFDKGQGCQQNQCLARHYYELAALGGHEESQFRIIWMFLLGERGERNIKKAKKFLKMYLEKDLEQSEATLEKDRSTTPKSEQREKASRKSTCALALAKIYRSDKAWDKAIKYYTQAGELDPDAKYECAQMLMEKDFLLTDEYRTLIIDLLKDVADQNEINNSFSYIQVKAQYHLAHLLNSYVQKIPPKRQNWQKTCEQWERAGLPWAPVEKAWNEAKDYYQKASSHGHVEAKYELARLLFYPIDMSPPDTILIKKLLIEASNKGHSKAQLSLYMSRNSFHNDESITGVNHAIPNEKLPEDYLKLAAEQNLPLAQHEYARWIENEGTEAQHKEKKSDRVNDLITAIHYYEKAIDTWKKKSEELSMTRATEVYLDNLTLTLTDYNNSLKVALAKQIDLDVQTAVTYSTQKSGLPCVSIKIEANKNVFHCEIEGPLERKDHDALLESLLDSGAGKVVLYEIIDEQNWKESQIFTDPEHEVHYSEKDLSSPHASAGLERLSDLLLSPREEVSNEIKDRVIVILSNFLMTCKDEKPLQQTIAALHSVTLKGLNASNCGIIVSKLSEFLREGATSTQLKKITVEALKNICESQIPAQKRVEIINELTEFLSKDESVSNETIEALTLLATGSIGADNYKTVVTKLMDVMLNGRNMIDPIAEALGTIAYSDGKENGKKGKMGAAIIKDIKEHLINFASVYDPPIYGCIQWHNKSGARSVLKQKFKHDYGRDVFVKDLISGIRFAVDLAQKVKP